MKRVVTGQSREGKSVFISEGEPPRKVSLSGLPALEFVELWATDGVPPLPANPGDPTRSMTSFVPGSVGTRFRLVRFPPESEIMRALGAGNPVEIMHEFAAKFPGIGDKLEPQDPAMHTTDTVDYGVVLTGEISLELDDGATVHLQPGDCVVQNGTRHGWRNRTDKPCVMAFVLVGAARTA